MDFRHKAYMTLAGKSGGILGAEMYVTPRGLQAYGKIIHNHDYYLAWADRENWLTCADEIAEYVPEGVPILEYGTGDAKTIQKTANIVRALNASSYIGVDKSRLSIEHALAAITDIKKDIEAKGMEIDFYDKAFPHAMEPCLALFAGGSIQNLETPSLDAFPSAKMTARFSELLSRTQGGWLLLSMDLFVSAKSAQDYERAYASPEHTEFNLAVFHRMRNELEINIDPSGFVYRAEFNQSSFAIEHCAYVTKAQNLVLDNQPILIEKGMRIHLQNSYKIPETIFNECLCDANLRIEKTWKHPTQTMALYLLRQQKSDMVKNTAKIAA